MCATGFFLGIALGMILGGLVVVLFLRYANKWAGG